MKKYPIAINMILFLSSIPISLFAGEAVDELLAEYRSQNVAEFSVESGETLWFQEFIHKKTGELRQCTTCHTPDLRQAGKHIRTGKLIEPLAPSVNPERLMDIKKIRKWLKRNCKWTLGRECTAQEKGDILTFIQAQ